MSNTPLQINIKGFFVSTLLFLFTLVLMFFIAEKIISLIKSPLEKVKSVSDYVQFNINYGLEPKPNINYMEYGYKVSVNSKSMFGPEISKEKKGLRLAYLGDSYSVGPGIDFKQNYPYLVTKRLKSQVPKVDFLIGGLGGSSPSQQKYIYKSKIVSYAPDVVVYELFDNDISDDYIFHYSQYYTRLKVYNAVPEPLRESKFIQQLMILLMNQLENFNKQKYDATKSIITNNPESIFRQYTGPSLDELFKMSKQNKAKLILVYIPSGWSFPDEYEKGKAKEKKYILGKFAKEWAKQNNIPYVDMYDDFKRHNTSELNEIFLSGDKGYHLTPLGASLVADRVYSLVINSLHK